MFSFRDYWLDVGFFSDGLILLWKFGNRELVRGLEGYLCPEVEGDMILFELFHWGISKEF